MCIIMLNFLKARMVSPEKLTQELKSGDLEAPSTLSSSSKDAEVPA